MKWKAVLDDQTCDKCRSLNGSEIGKDETPPNFYCESESGECRCVAETNEPRPCELCGGSGAVPEAICGVVTRDMAIDAGDLDLEGQPIPIGEEWVPCPACNRGEGH